MEERMNQRDRYIIMLRRIITGKAKAEEFSNEAKMDNRFSTSIVSTFLSDLLSITSDAYINNQMKIFRANEMRMHKRSLPHVFLRLQKDAVKRNSSSPFREHDSILPSQV
uniref:Uncharacterized protein n=1 Tax=Euplotes harpa TaxID=151035 RepID=A0A7S3JJM8_9SPIT|mmetsp:Transcript_4697/g.5612  ORF Transcript_4697/g.5612 Transcript_4697/m.5612 type:complete len:110 (+) Transcript_4697:601-930(+)